jgi:hypothetical protein
MDEDLANKDMLISNKFSKDIIKYYLEVFFYSNVEVLEVIDDDGVKFVVKESVKELHVDFIGMKI